MAPIPLQCVESRHLSTDMIISIYILISDEVAPQRLSGCTFEVLVTSCECHDFHQDSALSGRSPCLNRHKLHQHLEQGPAMAPFVTPGGGSTVATGAVSRITERSDSFQRNESHPFSSRKTRGGFQIITIVWKLEL